LQQNIPFKIFEVENLSQKNLLVVNNKYCSMLMKLKFQFIDNYKIGSHRLVPLLVFPVPLVVSSGEQQLRSGTPGWGRTFRVWRSKP
jgi:hypothetical protein